MSDHLSIEQSALQIIEALQSAPQKNINSQIATIANKFELTNLQVAEALICLYEAGYIKNQERASSGLNDCGIKLTADGVILVHEGCIGLLS